MTVQVERDAPHLARRTLQEARCGGVRALNAETSVDAKAAASHTTFWWAIGFTVVGAAGSFLLPGTERVMAR